MKPIMLVLAILLISFSQHAMAAQAQLKKPTSSKTPSKCEELKKSCTQDRTTATDLKDSKSYTTCDTTCKEAMTECIKEGKDSANYRTVNGFSLECRNSHNTLTKGSPKK